MDLITDQDACLIQLECTAMQAAYYLYCLHITNQKITLEELFNCYKIESKHQAKWREMIENIAKNERYK